MKESIHKRYDRLHLNEVWSTLSRTPIYHILWDVWHNPTDAKSLRLSRSGFQFLVSTLKVKSYAFDLSHVILNRHLLLLERFFPGIYYIASSVRIVVFDEEDATMLTLLSGDLNSYLEKLDKNYQ